DPGRPGAHPHLLHGNAERALPCAGEVSGRRSGTGRAGSESTALAQWHRRQSAPADGPLGANGESHLPPATGNVMNTAGFDIELQLSDTVTAPAGLEPLADALTAAATAVLQHQGLAPPAGLTILLADDEA